MEELDATHSAGGKAFICMTSTFQVKGGAPFDRIACENAAALSLIGVSPDFPHLGGDSQLLVERRVGDGNQPFRPRPGVAARTRLG